MSEEFTYQDVAEHNTKKDIFVVIHDKVYNCSPFIDEHPYVLPAFSCQSVDRYTPPFLFLFLRPLKGARNFEE